MENLVLYRYMPKKFCEKMVNDGEVRISSSSNFKDGAGMTAGQRDDEHSKSVVIRASKVKISEHDRLDPRVNSEITKLNTDGGQYKIDTTLNDPYWVLCLSVDLRLDLFDIFKSDAAVVIQHPEKLLEKMRESSTFLLPSPDAMLELRGQPVQYLGEMIAYGRSGFRISPCFTKPEKYKRQKEYRVVWYPRFSDRSHEYLQLGRLNDIAEIILRDDVKKGFVRERLFDENTFHKAANEGVRNDF